MMTSCQRGDPHRSRVAPALHSAILAAREYARIDGVRSGGDLRRDIKPANLLIAKGGLVKILDFGLAKLAYTKQAHPLDVNRES